MAKTLGNCLSLAGVAFLLASCASADPQKNIAGRYSVPHDSGVITNAYAASAADCDSPNQYQEAQGWCIEPTTVTDELTLKPQPNGDLEFDVWVNAFNGHSCSARGTAQQTGPQSWRFEQASQYSDAICMLDIAAEDGAITLRQDRDAGSNCSEFCGNRASLGGTFPQNLQQPLDFQ